MPIPLPPEIRQLPIPERIHLAEQIWDSVIADEAAFELTGSQNEELDRRIAANEADPERGTPWETVKQRLMAHTPSFRSLPWQSRP